MKSLLHFLSIYGLFFLSSCATVDYFGESGSPTTSVDIFYEKEDIDVNYYTFGRAVGMSGKGYEAIRKKLLKTAMKKGADAIIIIDLLQSRRSRVNYAFNPYENIFLNQRLNDGYNVKAIFIKYK